MIIKEITDFLESIAPLSYQESYDNSGLIVGDASIEITNVLITLDSTEAVVDEAIAKGANLIIAHHPIVFSGLKKLNGKNYVERTILKAIKNDIAIYAIHTNLDNVSNGVNAMIAERLGLEDVQILSPKASLLSKLVTFIPHENVAQVAEALFTAGAGNIGEYSEASFKQNGLGTFKGNENTHPHIGKAGQLEQVEEARFEVIVPNYLVSTVLVALKNAHPYEEVAYDVYPLSNQFQKVGSGMIGRLATPMAQKEFLAHLKQRLSTNCVRYTSFEEKKISRVAVCGGSGQFLLPMAKAAGAEAFVTADFKYHEFFDAENQLLIADVGHYESEQFTRNLIYRLLSEKFPTFAPLISETNTNPVNYF
jgi:dinuclear metal center YbgI/SA1388 family protein